MKLLIYSYSFAPNVGGVETIVLSLARGLGELRATDGSADFAVTLVTQTEAQGFDDNSLPFRVVRRPRALDLWRLVRGVDVVHVASAALPPLFCASLIGKPLVVEHHGYQSVCPNGLLLRQPDRIVCSGHFQAAQYASCVRCLRQENSSSRSLAMVLLMFPRNFLAKRASANIAISQHSRARCALPASTVIYHGIEQPANASSRADQSPRRPMRFAYVGRLVAEKGLEVLLEATRLLIADGESLQVFFVGDGPERRKLEDLITRGNLAPQVRITGFLTGTGFTEAVAGVDAVVMPSVWEETAGLAAIEQMARGRLVIASDIGGLREIVGDAGLKFAAGDARGLAEAMRRVIREPLLVQTLGEKARTRAQTLFQRDRMIAEHAEIYRRLAASGSR
jgi:glycogen synthase